LTYIFSYDPPNTRHNSAKNVASSGTAKVQQTDFFTAFSELL